MVQSQQTPAGGPPFRQAMRDTRMMTIAVALIVAAQSVIDMYELREIYRADRIQM